MDNWHTYEQPKFDKDVKAVQWEKTVVLTNRAGKTGYPYAKKREKLQSMSYTIYIKDSKCIIDLNI